MNMKFIYTFLILLCLSANWQTTGAQKRWSKKENAPFPGKPRAGAVAFVLDNKAYITTGSDTKDMWQYDPQTEIWTQMADFPGEVRYYSVAFVANGKAYVGLGKGIKTSTSHLNDFYEYTPLPVNSWKQIADFPGSARSKATAFSINNIGYVGTGCDTNNTALGDFYKYENEKWRKIASLENGLIRKVQATSFVINGYGYIFGGGGAYGGSDPTPYQFDPKGENGYWYRKYSYNGETDFYKEIYSFLLNDTPYLYSDSFLYTYNYNATSIYGRIKQVGFRIFNHVSNDNISGTCFFVLYGVPYRTTGEDVGGIGYDNSLWYDASVVSSIKTTDIQQLGIQSTIVEDNLIFNLKEEAGILKIFNTTGLLMLQQPVKQGENTVSINLPSNGLYLLSIETDHENYSGKIITK